MKISLLVLAMAGWFLAGCDDASQKTTQAVNTVSNAVDAPLNYVGAVVQAKNYSEKVIDVSYINQAIQMFNASEGRMPKNLQELVPNYVAKLPELPPGTKLVYDAGSGTVKAVKQ